MKRKTQKRCHFIYSYENKKSEFVYWSNKSGWGNYELATLFTLHEKRILNLPMPPYKNWIVGWGEKWI